MYQFQGLRVFLIQKYPRDAGVMHLFEKLLECTSAFVVHPRFLKQPALVPVRKDTYREVDVFAETHTAVKSS